MKKYFEELRPMERRLVIGVGVVLFIVLNWVFVWPHFNDWHGYTVRHDTAQNQLKLFQTTINMKHDLEKSVQKYENQGQFVAPDDQAINFMRTIQSQASSSGFGVEGYSPVRTQTNQFFMEQYGNINAHATEAQLVDFLYKIGTGGSLVRVSDLDLQPDQQRQHLATNVKLVASYQKKPKAPAALPAPATNTPTAKAK